MGRGNKGGGGKEETEVKRDNKRRTLRCGLTDYNVGGYNINSHYSQTEL